MKDDAIPTENKPLQDAENEKQITAKRATGTLSRRKVDHGKLQNKCLLVIVLIFRVLYFVQRNCKHHDRHKYLQLLCVDVNVTCYGIFHVLSL